MVGPPWGGSLTPVIGLGPLLFHVKFIANDPETSGLFQPTTIKSWLILPLQYATATKEYPGWETAVLTLNIGSF